MHERFQDDVVYHKAVMMLQPLQHLLQDLQALKFIRNTTTTLFFNALTFCFQKLDKKPEPVRQCIPVNTVSRAVILPKRRMFWNVTSNPHFNSSMRLDAYNRHTIKYNFTRTYGEYTSNQG